MMSPRQVVVDVHRSASGMFCATSIDFDGVYMAHRDLKKLIEDLPDVVKQWFKLHRQQDVTVSMPQIGMKK